MMASSQLSTVGTALRRARPGWRHILTPLWTRVHQVFNERAGEVRQLAPTDTTGAC
ncbi:MAG: hypothetical protein ACKVX7_07855 [Planctomycetota bacterium]